MHSWNLCLVSHLVIRQIALYNSETWRAAPAFNETKKHAVYQLTLCVRVHTVFTIWKRKETALYDCIGVIQETTIRNSTKY